MLPDETEVTYKSVLLIEPVNDTDSGVIVSPLVVAATGKFAFKALLMAVAALAKLVTFERFIEPS